MKTLVRRMLPDGSGRLRIHWLCPDENGPIRTEGRTVFVGATPLRLGGAVGRVACQEAKTSILPEVRGSKAHVMEISDDVRAATCPECLATAEAKAQLDNYATLYNGRRGR